MDDMMDQSTTRRGKICWYLKDNKGMLAINDGILLETSVYTLLHWEKFIGSYLLLVLDLLTLSTVLLSKVFTVRWCHFYLSKKGPKPKLPFLILILYTPHLKEKFLSTKSSCDFEGGLDTIKPNWFCPENRFAAKSTGCGAIYCWKNDIPSNMSNLKNNAMYYTNFLRPSTLLLCKKIIC